MPSDVNSLRDIKKANTEQYRDAFPIFPAEEAPLRRMKTVFNVVKYERQKTIMLTSQK